jgi:uncharacterized repeat protein (TIGR01451 family)
MVTDLKTVRLILLTGFLFTFATEAIAANWYDPNWSYRKRITINSGQVSGGPLSNFPMLINTTDPDWRDTANGGNVGQSDGGDILFTSSDGVTKLSHEIERYDNVNGRIVAWVNIPSISDGTVIYIYYGNPTVADQWDTENTWDSSYQGVWHLAEDPSISTDGDCGGGTAEICDSTINNNDGDSNGGMTSDDQVAGQVNGSLDFDGVNDYVDLGNNINLTENFTVESWINARSFPPTWPDWRTIVGDRWEWQLEVTDTARVIFRRWGPYQALQSTTTLSTNRWYHIVVTLSSAPTNNLEIYINGTSDVIGDMQTPLNTNTDSTLRISGRIQSDIDWFDGYIDEVRISTTVRSGDWIKTSYNNQSNPGSFYSMSSEIGINDTFTWTGTVSTDWANPANWDKGDVPIDTHSVIIPGGVPNDPILDQARTIAALTINTGGSLNLNGNDLTINGDITINGTLDASTGTPIITVGGNWNSSGGTFTQGSSTVMIGRSGQSNTITTDPSTSFIFYNLTINAGSNISVDPSDTNGFRVDGIFTISGTFSIPLGIGVTSRWANNLIINTGGELTGQGTYTRDVDDTTAHIVNNGTISIDTFIYRVRTWSGPQPITATTYGNNLIIKNLGSLDWPSYLGCSTEPSCPDLVVNGTLKIYHDRDGKVLTFDNSPYNIDITAGELIIGDSAEEGCGNLITGSSTITISGDVTINQENESTPSPDCNNIITSTNETPSINIGGSVINNDTILGGTSTWIVSGNWTNNDTFNAGNSTVILNGTSQSINGSNTFYNLTKSVTSADILIFDNTATQTIINNLTLQGASGQLLSLRSDLDSAQWSIVLQAGGIQSLSYLDVKDSDASGGIQLVAGSTSTDSGNNLNWVFNGTTLTWTGSTSTDWGTASNWDLGIVPRATDTVVIPDVTNDPVLDQARTIAALTIDSGGSLNLNGNDLTISGDVIINGTLDASTGTPTITVGGNWTNNGTLNAGSSTVALNGINQTLRGSTTFYNLTKTVTSSATLTFDNTSTQTITNTLTLNGVKGQSLLLRSDLDGEQWGINPQGKRNISYVDVKDANNIDTTWILAINSINSGNNTGWYFGVLTMDIDNDGVAEEARDSDGDSTNGYEIYFDPGGNISSQAILSADGDGDSKIDHFIDINADGVPDKYWDPDRWMVKDITLINTNRNGAAEWVYDADDNGTYDRAYNSDENTFVDPFGVVFDSITNLPIAGAIVTIYNSTTGNPCIPDDGVPPGFPETDECISAGDTNPVITPVSGVYGFNAVKGGSYYIKVEAKGYSYPFSPATRIFDSEWGRNICVNNPPTYPSSLCQGVSGSRGEIFMQGDTVIAMDHPVDASTNLLKVTKKANKEEAHVGEIITYTVTIESRTSTNVEEVYITDRIPPGFKYIEDRAILDGQKISDPEGDRPIIFSIGTVKPEQTRILKYQLIVGSGVSFSKYENSVWANYSNGTIISNVAHEEVKIVPDPLFDLGTVIGKVFWDRNENGVQDAVYRGQDTEDRQNTENNNTEPGIPHVQIITEEGTIITTDKDGKYHLTGITPGRHVLRIDERTLPEGAYLTTDKAVIVDITPGIIQKVNFGINKIRSPAQATDSGQQIEGIQQKDDKQTMDGGDSTLSTVQNSSAQKQSSINRQQTTDDDFIFVALADVKAGYTNIRGNIEPVGDDDRFQSGFWSKGRLAYYLKGKIKGKYLITSSFDTDREKKELFRNLDPDRYYPVYGDASTVNYEATDTQGVLYLAIEWDKSKAMWGNYHTDITDTELAQFKRTLYGAKVHYETVSTTPAGKPVTKLIIFQAEAKYLAAHNEFLGTGGSLYYLKHRPVIEGSEKVVIEVRDKITNLVIARLEQKEGKDYEIDYTTGRIMFYEPVSQIVKSSSIISNALLDGNHVYVVVDYEYEVNDVTYDEWSYGGRIEQSLKPVISKFQFPNSKFLKDIRLGGTYVRDVEDTGIYELRGIDSTFYLGEHTRITGEYAESQEEGIKGFVSTNGGLSFSELSGAETETGKAYSLKAETRLFDRVDFESYYRRIGRGFSSPSTISEQDKEILGGEMTLELSEKSTIKITHDTQKLIDEGNEITAAQLGASRTDTTTVQATHKIDKLKLTGEFRHIEVTGKKEEYTSETNESGNIAAIRADYDMKEVLSVFLEQQVTLDEDNKDYQTTAGVSTKVFGWLSIEVSETVGKEDNATLISARAKVDSKTEIYNTYSLSNSHIDGKRETTVTGIKKKVADNINLTTEVQNNSSNTEVSRTNLLGLSGKINEKWGVSGSYQKGMIRGYTGDVSKRDAGSIGISYVDPDRIKVLSKIELRNDEGTQQIRQYLSYNTLQWEADRNTTFFGKINLSESVNTTLDRTEAEYKEFVIGSAYRPVNFDRLNLLAKYTYLEDETAEGQSDMSDIEEQRVHVLAGEAVYDLTDKWQIVEKLAFKQAKEKVTGFDFTKTQTWLWINRVNYNFSRKWQVGAEYRILGQRQAKDMKQGALIEVSRYIGKNIQIGVGYNFTDFNDDLTYLDYTSHGPFIRLSARITD